MNATALELSRRLAESLSEPGAAEEETEVPTLEPGIHHDVPMDVYLRLPYVSSSGLRALRRSPYHFRHYLTAPRPQSAVMDRGTALHMALMEPDLFERTYVVAGACRVLLGKSSKRAGQECGNPGSLLHRELGWLCGVHVKGAGSGIDTTRVVLSAEDHAAVLAMRERVLGHRRARSMFEGAGAFETTVIFDDPETGIRCKTRPDRLVDRVGMHVAVKTTRDAAPWRFPRDAESLGYFHSLALYRRALLAVGWPYASTSVLAIENVPGSAHDLVCYLPDETEDLDTADAEVSRLLRTLRTAIDTDQWPGYSDEFLPLSRPEWAKEDG